MTALHGPLHGVQVVCCSTAQAGTVPYMLMADLGAEVIKIEVPEVGDNSRGSTVMPGFPSTYFETNNRGVKSVALNLKTAEGREILHRLVARAAQQRILVRGLAMTVAFSAFVEVPRGAGTIVAAEWDFDGAGEYAVQDTSLDGSASRYTITATYAFDEPGTYFPALRVSTQREGNMASRYARVQNLGRVRVIVS